MDQEVLTVDNTMAMSSSRRSSSRSARKALAIFTLLGCQTMIALAQSVTVARTGNAVAVRAAEFSFIKGEPLVRLKDGRSVRVDLELDVLPGPGGQPVAQGRRTYVLSYDLWEERFAVTLAGSPSRSNAYLKAAAAEAWCLEQLTVPVSALGRYGRDLPFWIRLGYRVIDADTPAADNDAGDFSLRGLVEALSRRRRTDALTHSIEAGPFRLPL
jgi:hypothetical protein